MKSTRAIGGVVLVCGVVLSACGDGDARAGSCSVRSTTAGAVITCDDGSETTIPQTGRLPDGGVAGCVVERGANAVVIECADGSRVSLPVTRTMDGGVEACAVVQRDDGDIAIDCPDGTSAVVPGLGGDPLNSLKLVGATTASCGTCHDSTEARAHFSVMTVQSADAGPVETCGTCHNEGSAIRPVSAAHARPELGAPGLSVGLSNLRIDPTTRRATVQVQFAAGGAGIPRTGVSLSLVLSKVQAATSAAGGPMAGPYVSYFTRNAVQMNTPAYPLTEGTPPRMVSQPAAENTTAGTWTAVGANVYDYTFKDPLPASYDPAATHVLAGYATRTVAGVRYVGNAELTVVPGGGPTLTRDIVRTETCNNCHNPLQAHGGSRQSVGVCLTCHTQDAVDPESNNGIAFNVMIHKIHMGKDLPSVALDKKKYSIIGNALSEHDWSHAGFPQPVANCRTCHTETDSDRWITSPSNAGCTSCHEYITDPARAMKPELGGHPFAVQPEALCVSCHVPNGSGPDALEAHVTGTNGVRAQTRVFSIELLEVKVDAPDAAPRGRVRALTGTRASGAVTPVTNVASFSMFEAQINGPNTGFALNGNDLKRVPMAMLSLTPVVEAPGEFTFTLPQTLAQLVGPVGDPTTDSYTLSLRAQFDPTPGALPDNDRVDMLRNPSLPFGAGETVVARTAIALTEKCNKCHGDLTFHGGANLAKNVEQCAMCHTSSFDTRGRQGANKQAGPTTSLRLATLVHRVHGSAVAERPYLVFGHSTTPPYPVIDLSHVGYPGDPRDCLSCHATGTYFLPLPEGDPPSRTVQLDQNGAVIGQ